MRVLLIEDSPSDAALIAGELADAAPDIEVVRAASLAEAAVAARNWSPDALLLDLGLPDSLGLETVQRARAAFPDSAAVVLTGNTDAGVVTGAFAGLAQDYLVKGECAGSEIARALRHAVERMRAERLHHAETAKLGFLLDQVSDALYVGELEGRLEYVNEAACAMLGYSREELLTMGRAGFIEPGAWSRAMARMAEWDRSSPLVIDSVHVARDGRHIPVEVSASMVRFGDRELLLSAVRDVTRRKAAAARQALLLSVLERLARLNDVAGAAADIVAALRIHTGLEAIAVRVREAGGLPYAVADGFEEGHRAEDWAGACQAFGEGAAPGPLPCLCGQVLEEAVKGPWATPSGSLCVGSARELREAVDAARRERSVIGTCLVEGYQSVALVPLHCAEGIVGLLQACDHRPGVLTREVVLVLEAVADALGVAVARQRDVDSVRDSGARYRQLIESMAEGLWTIDAEARTTYVSPRMAAMLGYEPGEMLGRPLFDFMEADAVATAESNVERRRSGIAEEHDFRFRRRDGTPLWARVSTTPLHGADGRYAGAQAMLADISEAREAQRAQRRLVAGIEQSLIATAVCDASGTVLYANGACLALHGSQPADVLGATLSSLCASLLEPDDLRAASEALASLRPWRGRAGGQAAQSGGRSLDISLAPVFGEADEVLGYVAMAQDVTEVESLEEQLHQAQKMEALGTLAGGVAHDFNNLLAVIRGQAELLAWDLPEDDPAAARLQEIQQAADRAVDLIRQLLAFSRKQILRPRVVDVNSLTEDMAKMLRRLLTEDVELHLDLAPGIRPVRADPGRLQQVLANLVVNARDAMPEGGAVTVSTGEVVVGDGLRMAGAVLPPGPYVTLTVRDTGGGMPPAVAARAFEPFFSTKGEQGTGLGLATVYGIAVQSGGAAEVAESTPQGTAMRVLIPVCDTEPESNAVAADAPRSREGAGRTVLVVEDDLAVLALASEVLRRAGYRVVGAASGAAAIEAAAAHDGEIALVLSDVVLTDLRGPQVVDRIAELRPNVRGMYMSGYVDDTLAASRALDGSRELLMKPFTAEALLAAVGRALAGATMPAEGA